MLSPSARVRHRRPACSGVPRLAPGQPRGSLSPEPQPPWPLAPTFSLQRTRPVPTSRCFCLRQRRDGCHRVPHYLRVWLRQCVQSLCCVRPFATPWTVAQRLLCPRDFSGRHSGVGCHFLLQGIFLTQGLNPSPTSLALQAESLPAEPSGSPQGRVHGKALTTVSHVLVTQA